MKRLEINQDDTSDLPGPELDYGFVLALAEQVALTVGGVVELEGGWTNRIANVLARENHTSGITVAVEDNRLTLNLHVVVQYGVRIPEVSWNLQDRIKQAVEGETGIQIDKINILIAGVKEVQQPR